VSASAVLTAILTALLNAIKNFLLGTSKDEIRQFHDKALVWQEESSKRRRTRFQLWRERMKDRRFHRKACRRWRQMERTCARWERKNGLLP